MKHVIDFLLFRTLMAPLLLQVLFWGGIGGTLYGTWWLFAHGNWAWVMSASFGPVMTRFVIEHSILRYRSHQALNDIRDLLTTRDAQRTPYSALESRP